VARIRTIKPEFWVDEQIVELDYVTRLLFIGLWNFVDDEGYIEYKPKRIKMQVFPADDLELSGALRNLLETRRLTKFNSDQGELVQITNWERHQKISHPTPTRFTGIGGPSSVSAPEDSGALGSIPDDSGLKGKERKGKERNLVRADRPDVDSICKLLADLIESNGSRRPTITDAWWNAARLMLDNDKRDPAKAEALMRWCQADTFWSANIMSMPKFRAKYDSIRLRANAEYEAKAKVAPAPDKRKVFKAHAE
jgi:hypothetical protein